MGQLSFEKSIHTALWGSESWEVSAHPSDPSVIVGGERKGATLCEVFPNFPLLFKVIDAKTRLSVQVHPNEETCKVTGGETTLPEDGSTNFFSAPRRSVRWKARTTSPSSVHRLSPYKFPRSDEPAQKAASSHLSP